MSDLARTVRYLADRASLHDLVVRYFIAADGDDLETVAASFTENAAFLSSGVPNAVGRSEIVEFIRSSRAAMGLTVHTLDATLFDFVDDDRATGLVNAHLELVLAQRFLFGAVRYEDAYARTAKGWRIERRDMKTIYMAPWTSVAEAIESACPVRWVEGSFSSSDLPRPFSAASHS